MSGLKLLLAEYRLQLLVVSPYTGEWIEIKMDFRNFSYSGMSHLTQVSGLKFLPQEQYATDWYVSPYTGEWIEIVR